MSGNQPPPEVVAAAKVVQDWVDQRGAAIATAAGAPAAAATSAPAPAADKTAGMSWAERLDHARTFDQSKMPENRYDVARRQRSA